MKHSGEKRKFSWAFVLSIGVHIGVGFYLTKLALDHTLPEGEVVSYDINYTTPQGEQLKATEVDVVEKEKVPELAPPPPPAPEPEKILPAKKPKAPPPMPAPVVASKSEVIDQKGDLPTEIKEEAPVAEEPAPEPVKPEEYTQNPVEEKSMETPVPTDTLAEKVQEPAVAAPPTAEAAPIEQAAQAAAEPAAYGTPQGTVMPESAAKAMPGNAPPKYPYWSRLRKQEGEVILYLYISAGGSVQNVSIAKSSGFPFLDNEAAKTYKQWKFYPGIEGTYERRVVFRLTQPAQTAPGSLRTTK